MRTKPQYRFTAFTLVEVVIVLGIIAVIAAISFSVFSSVREKGRAINCTGNLKQIALAMQQYIQDNNGIFPPKSYSSSPGQSVQWSDLIVPYVKNPNIFTCPTSKLKLQDKNEDNYAYNWEQLNEIIYIPEKDPYPHRIGRHESQVLQASSIALNFDNATVGYNEVIGINGSYIQSPCGPLVVGTLHSAGSNMSFIDGRVKWLSQPQQIEVQCAWDAK